MLPHQRIKDLGMMTTGKLKREIETEEKEVKYYSKNGTD